MVAKINDCRANDQKVVGSFQETLVEKVSLFFFKIGMDLFVSLAHARFINPRCYILHKCHLDESIESLFTAP